MSSAQALLNQYTDKIALLAKEVEVGDPIDWGMLQIDEENTYQAIALSVVEQFDKYDSEFERDIAMATIVKLVVENFILNLKLEQGK